MDLSWDDVRVFLALMDGESFRDAAATLGIHPSSVGRRLDALEAALDTRLFERSRLGITPTAAAETLLPAARHFERAAAGFHQAAGTLEQEVAGEVAISAPSGIANRLLVPHIPELLRRHPRLRVFVDTNNAFADLDAHEADLALRGIAPQAALGSSSRLVARRLGAAPAVPMASPAYAAELGTLHRLEDARWVTFGPRTAGFSWARKVLDHVDAAHIALRSDDADTVFSAVCHGVGASWMTRTFADAELVEIPLGPDLAHLVSGEEALWLVGHRATREVPRVAAVWAFLTEVLAAQL